MSSLTSGKPRLWFRAGGGQDADRAEAEARDLQEAVAWYDGLHREDKRLLEECERVRRRYMGAL